MSLLTVHKIFILSAIAVFLVYAGWETHNYTTLGDLWALPGAVASVLCAVGFALYLRSLRRRGRP